MRLRPLIPLGLLALAACVPRAPEPVPPPPEPVPTPTPTPAPPPPPPPFAGNWIDAPQTPGDWSYANGVARFGTPAATVLTLRCDRPAGAVDIIRAGSAAPGAAMVVRTETVDRSVALASVQPDTLARLPARDSLLDAMAFSRGRFAIEVAGLPSLYVPAWPEVTRVIEDCR